MTRPTHDAQGAMETSGAVAVLDEAPDASRGAPAAAGPDDGLRAAARRVRVRTLLSVAGGAAALGGAAVVAYLATRDAPPPAAAGGHDHAAMAAGAREASPVALTAAQAARIGVTYATATVGTLVQEVRTVGQITFDETRVRAVSPKVEGWVERLHVGTTGQPVRAGEPLLSVYSPMLVSAQEELLLVRRLVDDVRGADAEARRGAEELLASARRRLAYWDIPASEIAAIERTGEVRRALTLRAPASGYVLEKRVLEGQRIMAGDPLYRVADLSVVWVEGEVFEQDLAAVREGQMVHADFQALPGEHRMGRITYVYPTLDPETRTARVRVELPNPGLALKPGMYATIRIEGAPRASVLSVPRTAVLVTGERSLVFVRRPDGVLEPRDVRIGVTTHERVEILSGLAAGDTVVASATFLIDAESNLGSALGGARAPAASEGADHSAMDHSAMDHAATGHAATGHSATGHGARAGHEE
jgi:Cu(I)/Ag(I) efflux system membrane fusion protein